MPHLTLYLRRASRLKSPDPKRVRIIDGDVLDAAALTAAMKDQDVVYANLAGDMKRASGCHHWGDARRGLEAACLHQFDGYLQ